jgi:hypothetical protein
MITPPIIHGKRLRFGGKGFWGGGVAAVEMKSRLCWL